MLGFSNEDAASEISGSHNGARGQEANDKASIHSRDGEVDEEIDEEGNEQMMQHDDEDGEPIDLNKPNIVDDDDDMD